MTKEGVEDEEGDIWHHGGHSQVTIPGLLELIGTKTWSCGIGTEDNIFWASVNFYCAEFVAPVVNNLCNND